jgi:deferrochelatase/peroxidase EfeB
MARTLNLHDIQGNVVRAYGRYSYPFARYFFFNVVKPAAGRAFVEEVRHKVTTAARWPEEAEQPDCTVNIGFSFFGLWQLGVPTRTLKGMPDEFAEGMKDRAFVLGDRDTTKVAEDDQNWDAHWDKIWRMNRLIGNEGKDDVHIWISLNAQLKEIGKPDPVDALEERTEWLRELCRKSDEGVRLLAGHAREGDTLDHQPANAVFEKHGDMLLPTPKEHFGFADGIGDPVFDGQYRPEDMKDAVIGRGKRVNGKWEPIATGEFVLGHPDESQEVPPAALPPEFSHNGTFMAYRKLHEHVDRFDEVLDAEAERFAAVMDVGMQEARETLRAKMCGRWSDGVPLATVPTYAEWKALRKERQFEDEENPVQALKNQLAYMKSPEASDFRYADDMPGYKVPNGAHIRRMNTRDYLDPLNKEGVDSSGNPYPNKDATHALNKRRRILRRGLPYGPFEQGGELQQGVAMMAMGASLFRQFEFVQQQWVQYGLDFHQGNNTCPMLGDHKHHKRFTIPSDPRSGKPPYIMSKLKTFVECRGGEYFFIPSMTCLRMIAMGIVDPT